MYLNLLYSWALACSCSKHESHRIWFHWILGMSVHLEYRIESDSSCLVWVVAGTKAMLRWKKTGLKRRDTNMAVQLVSRLWYVCATKVVMTAEKRPAFNTKSKGLTRTSSTSNIIPQLSSHVCVMNIAFIFISSPDPCIRCGLFVGHILRIFFFIVTSHLIVSTWWDNHSDTFFIPFLAMRLGLLIVPLIFFMLVFNSAVVGCFCLNLPSSNSTSGSCLCSSPACSLDSTLSSADGLALPWIWDWWTINLVNGHSNVEYLAKGGWCWRDRST